MKHPSSPKSRDGESRRRAAGQLEGDVLAALWVSGEAMTVAAVQDALDGNLAYNTVLTILTRLHTKELVARERDGRAYAYRPVVADASDLVAKRMRAALDLQDDHAGVLQSFVNGLSTEDERTLRKLLRGSGR